MKSSLEFGKGFRIEYMDDYRYTDRAYNPLLIDRCYHKVSMGKEANGMLRDQWIRQKVRLIMALYLTATTMDSANSTSHCIKRKDWESPAAKPQTRPNSERPA